MSTDARPLAESYLQQIEAHRDAGGEIGQKAASALLDEVLRLRRMAFPSGEFYMGSIAVAQLSVARAIVTVDTELVRQRFYTPDGKTLLADLGCTPAAARKYAALFTAGAARIGRTKC